MYTFIETRLFTRLIGEYLSDDEFAALQLYMLTNPDAGDIVRNSGGVRKLRWGVPGRGKRGGIRVIYYLKSRSEEIWLLTVYAKNVRESIAASVLRQIKDQLDGTS